MIRRAIVALSAGLAALAPAYAFAYQCTPVPGSNPPLTQAWQNRCMPYWLDTGSALFGADGRQVLVDQSFSVWSENNCTDIDFMYVGTTDQAAGFDPARCDNKNIVAAIENQAVLNEFFDSPDLLAVTLTSFSRSTGEIFDADVLFNTVNFQFVDVSTVGTCEVMSPRPYDLRNTLIHEIGHFIGFDHVTNDPAATMFPSAVQCETDKRSLEVDDSTAVCTTYPKDLPTATCRPPSSYELGGDPTPFRDQCANAMTDECVTSSTCSCRTTAPSRSGIAWGLLLLVPLALRRRRR